MEGSDARGVSSEVAEVSKRRMMADTSSPRLLVASASRVGVA